MAVLITGDDIGILVHPTYATQFLLYQPTDEYVPTNDSPLKEVLSHIDAKSFFNEGPGRILLPFEQCKSMYHTRKGDDERTFIYSNGTQDAVKRADQYYARGSLDLKIYNNQTLIRKIEQSPLSLTMKHY